MSISIFVVLMSETDRLCQPRKETKLTSSDDGSDGYVCKVKYSDTLHRHHHQAESLRLLFPNHQSLAFDHHDSSSLVTDPKQAVKGRSNPDC
jgi:hypothetical protein